MLFNPFNLLGRRKPEPQPRERVEPGFADSPVEIQAATALAPIPLTTGAPKKPLALPSFKTQVARSNSALRNTDRRIANTDITSYRSGTTTQAVVRDFVAASPDMAATVNAYLRVGLPEKYTVVARSMDGAIDPEATSKANEILRRLTYLADPSLGYNPVTDLESLSESLAKELLMYGAMAVELVLDKQLEPSWITPVSVTRLEFWEEEGGVYPVQVLSGNSVRLDVPTFFYISLDQDMLTAYASSYLESAIQAVVADAQFMNDLRRAMGRAIQPRMVAKLVTDKLLAGFPVEIRNDPELQAEKLTEIIETIASNLEDLQPEDALVSSDAIEYDVLAAGGNQGNTSETLKTVQALIDSKMTAGMKSLPAVLGRDGTSGGSTVSSMLFLKNANILRRKLNVLYSRVLTQALRIKGDDVYVEFKYKPLDLRPESELEAYAAMEQSRIMEQLSTGMITDELACLTLTGNLPPDGYTPLSGTMFKSKSVTSENPNSQTSNLNGQKDDLKPTTPAQPKS